jgi:hypothetical protein
MQLLSAYLGSFYGLLHSSGLRFTIKLSYYDSFMVKYEVFYEQTDEKYHRPYPESSFYGKGTRRA